MVEITSKELERAKVVGKSLNINWNIIDLHEFAMGMEVELEHGTRYPETNVTNNDETLTGMIAWAHLKEFPDYYTRLLRMEEEAEDFWTHALPVRIA